MTKTFYVETESARIYYDVEGSGPLLLTIAGGGGSAPRYAGISAILKDEYTVIRYDRRCCSRSTGDMSSPMDMAQQARDAVAIIKAMNAEKAYLFGNSGGSSIALKIAEDYPEVIQGMVTHEPATLSILPDYKIWEEFMAKVEQTYHEQGVGPAMGLFASSLVGFDAPSNQPGHRIGDRSSDDNLDFFLNRELHSFSSYVPDLALIKRNKVSMIAAAGLASKDARYARTAKVVSDTVSCPHNVISGNHIAFISNPILFSSELRPLLKALEIAGPNR